MQGLDAFALVALLKTHRLRLAVAESCTGGMLGAAVTDVPGASEVFAGGVIAYDDGVKQTLLKVPAKALKGSGAVSATCAEAMAHGVRELMKSDVAVAVTGVAGPGASLRKPAGTVWIAVLGPEHLLQVKKFRFKGDRQEVRGLAVKNALALMVDNVTEAHREGVA
jgi:PncC family amidohydrolase